MSDRGEAVERAIDILLVEPNPGDARLVTESFVDANIANVIHVVTDGDEALDFVHQRGDYADAPRPDIVLLDLHLNGTSGEDVLEELTEEMELHQTPVIVLTSSDAEEDIVRSYGLHANAYLQKPVEPDEFIELARSFEHFWVSLVRLPPKDEE